MFRIECFVDDKHVAKALLAFDGIAIDLKVVPVRNAQKKNGKLQSTAANTTLEAITGQVSKMPEKGTVTTAMIRDWLAASGFAASSWQNALQTAVKAKVLKRTKTRGQYVVLKGDKAT